MSDDPDPKTPTTPGFGDLETPFLFVPHGAPDPVEWMRKHPGWVKFPATFVPRAPAAVRTIPGTNRPWPLDKRGQPWPRSRFGQPLRPLDEYPPGVRAPGEGYTGPIADPDEAMRAAVASEDVLAQAAKYAADPDAPIKAYLTAMEVWKNPGKYVGYPRMEAASMPTRAESAPVSVPLHDAPMPMRDGAPSVPTVAAASPVPGIGPSERLISKPYGGMVVTVADRDRREDEKKQQEQGRKDLRVGPQFRKQSGGMEVPNVPLLGGAAPMPRGTMAPPTRAALPSPIAGAPTSKGDPTPKGDAALPTTKDVLTPGGQPVGVVQRGATPEIRTVSPSEFQRIQADLMIGARPVAKPGYPGMWYRRSDGAEFGLRQSGRSGVTIDVDDPNLASGFKVHQNER